MIKDKQQWIMEMSLTLRCAPFHYQVEDAFDLADEYWHGLGKNGYSIAEAILVLDPDVSEVAVVYDA